MNRQHRANHGQTLRQPIGNLKKATPRLVGNVNATKTTMMRIGPQPNHGRSQIVKAQPQYHSPMHANTSVAEMHATSVSGSNQDYAPEGYGSTRKKQKHFYPNQQTSTSIVLESQKPIVVKDGRNEEEASKTMCCHCQALLIDAHPKVESQSSSKTLVDSSNDQHQLDCQVDNEQKLANQSIITRNDPIRLDHALDADDFAIVKMKHDEMKEWRIVVVIKRPDGGVPIVVKTLVRIPYNVDQLIKEATPASNSVSSDDTIGENKAQKS